MSDNKETIINDDTQDAAVDEKAAAAAQDAADSEQETSEPSEEKDDAKKTSEADKKLAEALAERDNFKDKYLRTFSEYNNYKKRVALTRAEGMRDGRCEVIEKILPVLDNFERALEHIEDEDNTLVQGFVMVYRQLAEVVQKLGVCEIPAQGEVFDPNKHQAVQMVEPQEGQKSGTVAQVALKGYMMEDRVIRPSMVIVNK